MTETLENPTIDRFLDLFLAALVLRGKYEIWVRRNEERVREERRRMHALHEFMCKTFEEQKDTEHKYFLVRLRNHLGPSLIGSFDYLLHSIFRKFTTIISADLSYGETYDIELQPVTAQNWLAKADPWLRKLAEDAADAYMADVRSK